MKIFSKNKERTRNTFGKHKNDFQHQCKFVEQIKDIGQGTKNGHGELVEIEMRSGKTAIYRLFSERYNHVFDNTGQKNWYYLFEKYQDI